MMTLLAILATVAVIVAIARYNENDKLMWQLLIAFGGSYLAATAVHSFMDDKKESDKVVMIEKAPTQVLSDVPTLDGLVTGMSFSASKRTMSAKPVSKDSLISHNISIISKVHASPRGQPTWRMFFDDG